MIPATGEQHRRAWTRRGMHLAQTNVAYSAVEGIVAVSAGWSAGLVSLIGFGFDSAIESAVSMLVWLRLSARLRSDTVDEVRERRTLRAVAVAFHILAAYIVVEAVRGLLSGEEPDSSALGMAMLTVSLVVNPVLATAKDRTARALGGDRLIHADAAQTWICLWLSAAMLAGLITHAITGWSWLDPLAGLAIAGLAIREGRGAWRGRLD